jgi:hypothetical protein
MKSDATGVKDLVSRGRGIHPPGFCIIAEKKGDAFSIQ